MSPYSLRLPAQFNSAQAGSSNNNTDPRAFTQGLSDPLFVNTENGVLRSAWDDDEMGATRKLAVRIALAVPPPKNKLKKPRGADANGYESDAGYVSDGGKKSKVKTKKSIGWRRKAKVEDDDDSDAGYRSEAVSGERKKTSRKEKDKGLDADVVSPLGDSRDPGALLATINASVLPESSSDAGHSTSLGHSNAPHLDGYLTDTGSTEKRGRTKTKTIKANIYHTYTSLHAQGCYDGAGSVVFVYIYQHFVIQKCAFHICILNPRPFFFNSFQMFFRTIESQNPYILHVNFNFFFRYPISICMQILLNA